MTTKRKALFTMGLPGAGKSTVASKRYNINELAVVDPDIFKESHPDYDPKDPGALHEWSSKQAEHYFSALLFEGSEDIMVDGTGTNAEKMIRRINQAKAAGYEVELLYVSVPLRVALERNANRERVVPESILREKALDISTAFEIVAPYADSVVVVNNS